MSIPGQHDDGALPRAIQLIADVRSRDEALRQETERIARLREAARTAAEQEATAIVAKARADIRHIIGDARAALLALKSQLEEIAEPRPEVDAALRALGDELAADHVPAADVDDDRVPDSVREVQGELQRLFAEGERDLDAVAAQASASVDAPADRAAPGSADPWGESRDARSLVESESAEAHVERESAEQRLPQTRGKRLLTIFGAIAFLGVAGVGAWWYVAVRPADARQNTVLVIPRPPALAVAPAAATEIPTVTGSLVALPPQEEPHSVPVAAPADPSPR
jgi:hypothetical protein